MNTLDLYNEALLLLGQRQLASITEDREPRYRLDGAYNRLAVEYCLQLVQPSFAGQTVALSAPAVGTTFNFAHTLSADEIEIIGVFSDRSLDQPVTRYIKEGGKISCDYNEIWVRYISNTLATSIDSWPAAFFSVVGCYLALQTATRLSPDDHEKLELKFQQRVGISKETDGIATDGPGGARPSGATGTMTEPWRAIYNDALQCMGLNELTSINDDSNRRRKLDIALDSGLVSDLLEDTGWQFAFDTTKIFFDPSVTPAFGHPYAIQKPIDMHRIDGVWSDEFLQSPVTEYQDEGNYLYVPYQFVFLTYVSNEWLTNPSRWPRYFTRMVAARMAHDASASLRPEGADSDRSELIYERRRSSAMSNDAMASPPRTIAEGNWTTSRFRGGFRGRP